MSSRQSAASLVALPRLVAVGESRHKRGDGEWHTHGAPEIVLVLKGPYNIAIGDQVLAGNAGTLFILPAKVPHAVRAPGAWASRYVIFEQPIRMLDETPRTLNAHMHPRLARWLEDLHELCQREREPDASLSKGLLLAILSCVARMEEKRRAAAELHPALVRATRFLETHLTEEVDAETLVAHAFVSHGHLCRLFREQFACSPRSYQMRLRLEFSRRLLADPYLTVKEVALQSGFEDVNYFVRLFKRQYRRPPGAWRRSLRVATTTPEA